MGDAIMDASGSLDVAAGAIFPDASILRVHHADGVAWLTMNRPAARNALSMALIAALDAALDDAQADPAVRVVVVAGAGPAFCAGHDLRELRQTATDQAALKTLFERCAALMTRIVRHPRPVIARVHGVATAAGCQLVASCDLAIAADTARFATPGVDIGLFCSTPMVALSRNVGRKAAMEMLLTGEMITADRAAAIGLINRVVPEAELDDAITALAATIAAKSRPVLSLGKAAFHRQAEMDLDAAYAYASDVMVRNMQARDAAEGIEAFLVRRAPKWTDA